jgi:hypothetical protein
MTTTTNPATTATTAPLTTFQRPADSAGSVLAQLPAQLLHIAAQFASDDDGNNALCAVHVACVDATDALPAHIRIASTNSHYAFRCRLFVGEAGFNNPAAPFWCGVPELQITASAFRKRPAYAHQALIRADGEARLYGARRGQALGLLEARPIGDPVAPYRHQFPPAFDSLWPAPEAMANAPAAPIAWNASYMGTIGAIATRYNHNGVLKFRSGALPQAPLYLECDCAELSAWVSPDNAGGDLARLEFLLMPVQLRS